MGFAPSDATLETVAALVRNDGLHQGGLAHDAAGRFQAHVEQVFYQASHPDAADFLVIRKREMQWCVGIRCQKLRRHHQRGGNVAFHVGDTSAIQLVAHHGRFKRIRVPGLALDRHHIGVSR